MMESTEGWTPYLLLICIEVTIGTVLPVGFFFGVVNAPGKFIKLWAARSANSRYSTNLSDAQVTLIWASIVSIFQIGGICGSLCAASVNTKLGRRGTLQLCAIIFMVSAILQLFCHQIDSLEMLLLGRLLGGVASAFVYSTQPMYLVELAPPKLSGSVGVFTCIGITGGIVMGQIFSFDFIWGTDFNWHWALAGFIIFVMIGMLPIGLFPESPSFLMAKGHKEQSRAALMKLRKNPDNVNKELADIEAASKLMEQPMSMKTVCRDSKLKMALILVCSFHFAQQGSGCNAIFNYSVGIFTDAGFSNAVALWLNFSLGVLNFIAACCGPFLMAHINRRIMMMLSCILSFLFMLLLCLGLKMSESFKWTSNLCILFLATYILSFNMGLGPIPYFIGSEIVRSSPLSAIMAFGSLSNWLTNFIVGMVFPILDQYIGPFAFLPFAIICLYAFLLTFRYLPETRKHTPDEIAPLLENGFKSKIK